jgi:hypothetical protein
VVISWDDGGAGGMWSVFDENLLEECDGPSTEYEETRLVEFKMT